MSFVSLLKQVVMTCCLYPDGNVVTVVDVLHITHAAIATVSVNFLLLESNPDVCASILPLTPMHIVLGSDVRNHFWLYVSVHNTQLFSVQNKVSGTSCQLVICTVIGISCNCHSCCNLCYSNF